MGSIFKTCICISHLTNSIVCITEELKASQELRSANLCQYDLDEEKQSWLLLMRQAIVDWEFLDNMLRRCFPSNKTLHLLTSAKAVSSEEGGATQAGLKGLFEFPLQPPKFPLKYTFVITIFYRTFSSPKVCWPRRLVFFESCVSVGFSDVVHI